MPEYRQIHVSIWKDPWFFSLSATEKFLFIYLFSNERANLTGLYELPRRVIMFETALTTKQVDTAMKSFEKSGKVYCFNEWIWVPNLIKYNSGSVTSPTIRRHITKALAMIPDMELKARCIDYFNLLVGDAYRMDTLDIPYSIEQEQEHEQEQEENKQTATKLFYEMREYWNETLPKKPSPRKDNKTLVGLISRRLSNEHFIQNWRGAMLRASQSKKCLNSGWFDFEWLVKNDNNYEKALNGKYDDWGDKFRDPPPRKVTPVQAVDL